MNCVRPSVSQHWNSPGVYQIRNTTTGELYIGGASRLRKRFQQHTHYLRHGTHANRRLQDAFNRYGEESFEFRVIVVTERTYIRELEQSLINAFRSTEVGVGYNIATDTEHSLFAPKRTAEHASAISQAKVGCVGSRAGGTNSQEHRDKVGDAMRRVWERLKAEGKCRMETKQLTEAQLTEAQAMFASGTWTLRKLAPHFGVSLHVIRTAILGKRIRKTRSNPCD